MTTINGTTNNNQWTYKLEVFEDSYSIENNTSNVTVKVYLGRASSRSYVGGNWTGTVTVNGATRNVSGTIPYPTYIDGGAWYEIKSETFTSILHNDDGSKTIGVSATMSSTVFTPSSCSASGNVTLTTIPRASSISCSGGNIGSATTISISRASSSFTHTLIYSFGSLTNRTIVTKTSSTSISWTIPTSFYAQIPNSNSGTVTLTCWTYSGSTLVGTSTTTCAVKVTNSNPTFTASQLTYLDSNSSVVAITENNQHIVRNQSNLKVTYTAATGKNSATISSYVITFNGGTQTKTAAATIDYGKVNLSSNATVSVKAIDSRGNSTTISKTIQIKDWVLPSATITAGRVNNYEDETHLKANVTISSVNSKNAIQSIQYRYKKSSESNYGSYVSMSNNVQSTLSIDKLYAWDFQIAIADKFGSTTYNFTIAKGMPIMFFDVNKLSVGVNSFPKTDKVFDVDGNVIVNEVYSKNRLLLDDGIDKKNNTQYGTLTRENNGIKATLIADATGTTYGYYSNISYPLRGLEGKTLTFSYKPINNFSASGRYGRIELYYATRSGERDENIGRANTDDPKITFTVPSILTEWNERLQLTFLILPEYSSTGNYVIFDEMMLEEGTSVTDYHEHRGFGYVQGQNDNGSYIKYDDGTMICRATIGTSANESEKNIYFPTSFINSSFNVIVTNIYSNSKKVIWTVTNSNKEYFTVFPMSYETNSVPTSASSANYIAIGRWK